MRKTHNGKDDLKSKGKVFFSLILSSLLGLIASIFVTKLSHDTAAPLILERGLFYYLFLALGFLFDHLRIIPQELWDRVQAKLKGVEEARRLARNKSESIWGKNRGLANHLFTGSMVCDECGGNFMTISGKGGGYLGCRNAHRVGICKNRRMVLIRWVEYTLLAELRDWIDNPETLERICKRINGQVNEKLSVIPDKIREIEKELGKVQKNIDNFVGFIAEGNASETVATALKKSEEKKASFEAQLFNLRGREPKRLFLTPYAIKGDLINLDMIIGQDIPRANAYIKSMFVDVIRMVPKAEDGGYYEAQGQVNLTKLMRFTVPVNGVPICTLREPFEGTNLCGS